MTLPLPGRAGLRSGDSQNRRQCSPCRCPGRRAYRDHRTPLYHRMTPVLWCTYPVWAVNALLEGSLLATYVRAGAGTSTRKATAGGVLSFLAAASLALLGFAVRRRLSGLQSCPVR